MQLRSLKFAAAAAVDVSAVPHGPIHPAVQYCESYWHTLELCYVMTIVSRTGIRTLELCYVMTIHSTNVDVTSIR